MFEKGKIYLRINLSSPLMNINSSIEIKMAIFESNEQYIHSQTLIVYSQRRKAWKFEFGELKMFEESDTMNLIKYNIIPQGNMKI